MRSFVRWRVRPQAAVLALLAGLDLVLGAWLATSVGGGEAPGARRAAWEAPVPRTMAGVAGRQPLQTYAEILAHPVFQKSREPFVPPPPAPPPPMPVAAPPPVATDPGLQVGGVMINSGTSKAYLLSKVGGGAGSWVNENETFQGWRVTSIDASGVRIEQAGRAIELQLYPKN
ncbi:MULTISPECIES: hypothetical protein [unclassified Bradyrhizobium]|uniref:hypothetical protein n=1 Tax=unclassified Bradyrhizobium TaxID=2631580 RepID=UPI0028EADBD5|nr:MULTISPECIES: hypothetical protein [unclassified Bradyrhizobium]